MGQGNLRLVPATIFGGIIAIGALGMGIAGAQPSADPPGNNGTVKVDDTPFDDHPDNEPHVGCVFQIDFAGFDEGDLNASVLFEAWPPTTTQPKELLTDPEIFIGEDAAGGAVDNDASRTYDLTNALVAIDPHPVQGWHVKLTVHADSWGTNPAADTKFKVFWVSGCGETPPTTQPPGSTTTTTKPGNPGHNGSTTTTAPPVVTPPGATPVEPGGPIIFAG
jgi:hypothetical protein